MACTSGLMARDTLGSGFRMRCRAKEFSSGLMVVTLRANLSLESCTATEFTLGRTAVAMKAFIASTKSMEKGFTPTVTAANITGNGWMGSSMA